MPRKKDSDRVALQSHVTQSEHELIVQAAKADRRSISQWVAKVCVAAAERELDARDTGTNPGQN